MDICDSFILSTAMYRLHLTPLVFTLHEKWAKLRKDVLIYGTRCVTRTRRDRLWDITKLRSLQERKGVQWNMMVSRIKKKAASRDWDNKAKQDCKKITRIDNKLGNQRQWTWKEVVKRSEDNDTRRHRRLQESQSRRDMPCMTTANAPIERAAFLL